jgi:uncharacterized repeat protein (TIGR01451 family)
MKRKNILFTTVLFKLFIICSVFVYGQDDDIYSLTATGENMVVCGPEITFRVIVKNNTTETIENLVMFPGLPTGVAYVSGSAGNMTEISADPEDASFQVQDIDPLDSVIVSYKAKADCRLIDFIQSGATGTSALANNYTRYEYTLAGTSKYFNEPNGSSSYNVSYADIELFVHSEDADIIPDKLNEPVRRRISIKNSGIGYTDSLTFNIKHATEIEFIGLYLADENYNIIEQVNPVSVTDTSYEFQLYNFYNSGDNDNLLEENEIIYLVDSVKLLGVSQSSATDYSVRWGCEGNICNADDQEAEYSAYIRIPIGSPNIYRYSKILQKTEFNSDSPSIIEFKLSNIGSGNNSISDAAINVRFSETMSQIKKDYSLFIIHQETGELIDISSYVTEAYSGYLYINRVINFSGIDYDIDGEGGLSDLDNDGQFDDLAVGDTIHFRQLNTFSIKDKDLVQSNYLSQIYYNCYSIINTRYSSWVHSHSLFLSFTYSPFQGNQDLQDGETSDYRFIGRIYYDNTLLELPNTKSYIKLIVPSSFTINSILLNDSEEKFIRTGDTILISNLEESISGIRHSSGGLFHVNSTLDCYNSTSLEEKMPMSFQLYFSTDTIKNTEHKLLRNSADVSDFAIYNNCLTCNAIESDSIVLERTSFGWEMPSEPVSIDDLLVNNTVPRATRNTPGIHLNYLLPYDTCKVSIKSHLKETADSYDQLHAQIAMDKKTNTHIFDYLYGFLIVDEDTFAFNNSAAVLNYFEDGLSYYDVTVPLGTDNLPAVIEPGSNIEVIMYFFLKSTDIGKQYPYYSDFSEFSGLIYGLSNENIPHKCSKVYFKTLRIYSNNVNVVPGGGTTRCPAIKSSLFYIRENKGKPFGNEYRPLFYLKELNINLPDGFEFDTSGTYISGSLWKYKSNELLDFNIDNTSLSCNLNGRILLTNMSFFSSIEVTKDSRPSKTNYYEINYEYISNFTLPSEYQSVNSNNLTGSIRYQLPEINLSSNTIQEGYSNTIAWPISFCFTNTVSSTIENVWVAVELKDDDNSTVLLGAETDEGESLPVIHYGPIDDIRPQGRHILVQLGTVASLTCSSFNLVATYKNCVNDRVQDIDLISSWHCYNYPEISDTTTSIWHIADKRNEILTGTLSLRYKTSNIQWNIHKLAEAETELCEPVPFEIDVTSTKYADMFDAILWCELPDGVTLDEQPTYTYPLGSSSREIPESANLTDGNRIGWRLTSLTGGYLPGTRTDTNALKVNLSVTPSCGFNSYNPVKFQLEATTNCNDEIILDDQRKINILGLELDTLSVNVEGGYFSACNTNSQLHVRVTNQSDKPSLSSMFEVEVPSGVSIIRTGNDSCLIEHSSDGTEHLYWNIPAGYLQPGESFEMTVPVKLNCVNMNFDELNYRASTSINRKAYCITGGECNLGTTTGEGFSRILYEPVLDLEPVCSENIDTECRWKVKNLINQTVTFTYRNGSEIPYGTRSLIPGDSIFLITPIIPELTVQFEYEDYTGILSELSISKRCGNNIDCKDFSFELIPSDVSCPGEGNGNIHVEMPDLDIYDFSWRNENDFSWRYYGSELDLQNVFADDYSLRVIILDRDGNFCVKREFASVNEPELHIKMETELYEGISCTGAYGVVKLNGVLQEDTARAGWYNCYDTAYAAVPFDTTGVPEIAYNDTLVIHAGETVTTSSLSGFTGVITVAGGTLFVQRYFKPKEFSFTKGTIIVDKSTLFDVPQLIIPSGCTLENYGVLEAPFMDIQGQFSNYYKFTSDTVLISGEFSNYNEGLIIEQLINNGNFYNQGDLEIFGLVENNGIFTNECSLYTQNVENKTGNAISNAGYLEIESKFTNQNSATFEIATGSEIVIDTLANYGDFSVNGDSCFCFTVFNLAEGTGIPPIDGNSGTCGTTCRYASGAADNASLVNEEGTMVDSLQLTPGLHTIYISLNESCVIEEDIYIDGGLEIETNIYDSICPGGESYLACEINAEGETFIEATYDWYPLTGIVDYDPSRDYQIVKPEETTEYILTVNTEDGCSGRDTVTIYVIDYKLDVDLDENEICTNDSIVLNAVANLDSYYLWEPDEYQANSQDASTTISNFERTGEFTYWVTATSTKYGCELNDTLTFTVNSAPDLEVFRSDTSNTINCSEADVEFTVRGADEYSWYLNNEVYSSDSIIQVHFTDSLSVLYAEGRYSASQCKNTSLEEVVRVIQKPDIEVGTDPEACIIPYQQLYVSGGDKYAWYPSEGLSDTTLENPTALIHETKRYYVQVSDTFNCTYTDSITLNPILWPEASTDEHICYGDSVQLNVTGGLTDSYKWSPAYALDNAEIAQPTTNTLVTTQFVVEAKDEYGCLNTDTMMVYVDPSCRCYDGSISGTTFQWTGAENNEWTNINNWTNEAGLNRYPGLDPTDNVIIDTASLSVTPVLNNGYKIKNLCLIGGKLNISSNSLIVSGDATFIDGEVISVPTEDIIPVLIIGDSVNMISAYFTGTIFNTPVRALNCSELLLNGSVFNGNTYLEQGGDEIVNCLGGNIYNGNTQIVNSGTGILRLAFNDDGKPDVYNGNITFDVTGSGEMYPSSSYTDTVRRNLTVNNKPVVFGQYGGSVHFCGEVDQFIGSDNISEGMPTIRKLEIGKDPNIAYSKLTLDIPVKVGTDSSDYLKFISGTILSDPQASLHIGRKTRVIGQSDAGYVEGPVVKTGNEDFTYPLGAGGYYMPLRISGAESIDTTMLLYAEYIPTEQRLGPPVEPITSVSTCEYWKLYETNGRHDIGVDVTLSWSPISCDVLTDLNEMQVVSWDSLKWLGKGNAAHTGTRVSGGTLTTADNINYYQAFAYGSEIMADYGPTVGLSLNNYGAIIKVAQNAHITVNGNILNEQGKTSEGEIQNEGKIYFKSDWTNNSTQDTVALNQGTYELFGGFQRLRGTQPTTFSNLVATGHGRKELYADIYINDTIYINDNNISTKRNSLHITNTDPTALRRTTGYFSSSRFGGFLRRDIVPAENFTLNQNYLFPVGSSNLYRPVMIAPGTDYSNKHTFSVRFLPYNPSIDTLNTTDRSVTVKDVNTKFYHVIESDYSVVDTITPEPVHVRFFFNRDEDGLYQSLGHWDNEPEVLPEPYVAQVEAPLWKKASPLKIYIDTTDIITPHSLELRDWTDFSTPNFALISGAYVINTNQFGNPYYFNDQGVVYSMEGDAFVNQQPLYTTGHSADIMGEPISPESFDSTEISNVMVIKGDAFSKPGKIELTTYSDGTIAKDKETGNYKINFIDDLDNKYILSPTVYEVINGTILILKSSEDFAPNRCTENIKISFSGGSPLVFSQQNRELEITNRELINRIAFIDIDDNVILDLNQSDINNLTANILGDSMVAEGIYRFIIEVIDENSEIQSFNGQFIVTE